jgi:hypothetical protein
VFFGKIPENVSGRLGKSGNSGKKVQFSGFQDDAKIQPISGKSAEKISGKIGRFRRKTQSNPENSEIPENFGKKSAKTSILENSTLVCRARFKTHILRELKSIKKSENLGTLRTGFPEMHEISRNQKAL